MRIKVWGARGSVPSPGPEMNRYGGNTSCVELTLDSGEHVILDAGTGIRTLGLDLTFRARTKTGTEARCIDRGMESSEKQKATLVTANQLAITLSIAPTACELRNQSL